ncbi:hypothetical protein [Nocardia sp. NPDC052566]|uniref:DUF7373 family lipoprotein n=1 Tax=Nocardia sp. NPDC052566 TaxID=3364330 RepID=UPI0037C6B287
MITRRMGLLAATAAVALTGCAAPLPGDPHAGEIDVRTLDIGNYSTEPLDLRTRYKHNPTNGKQLAAMRLADHVVTGSDIDPDIGYQLRWSGVGSAWGAVLYEDLLPKGAEEVLDRNGMLFGFSSAATAEISGKTGELDFHPEQQHAAKRARVAVLQFPDEDSARRAATELDVADFAADADQNQPVTLPNYPGALAHWRPDWPSIGTTMAHGRYAVSIQLRLSTPDLAGLTAQAEKAYAAQLPLLDSLKPLSAEEVLLLDYDPQGILRRSLNVNGESRPATTEHAAFGLQGYLHTRPDRSVKAMYAKAGADVFGINRLPGSGDQMTTIRTRDDEAAKGLARDIFAAPGLKVIEPPANIPDATCVDDSPPGEKSWPKYVCVVRYRRYVAHVFSNQVNDARQRAAAQYALFANSQ